MPDLAEIVAGAWTPEDNELLSWTLQTYAVDDMQSAIGMAELHLIALGDDPGIGRALLWLPGRIQGRRRELLERCIQRAVQDVGMVQPELVPGPEVWIVPRDVEQRQVRALALLAEVARRGKLPPLRMGGWPDFDNAWRVDVPEYPFPISALAKRIRWQM